MKVRILRYGLTENGRIYQAGEVIDNPSPRLCEIAVNSEIFKGERLAEIIEEPDEVKEDVLHSSGNKIKTAKTSQRHSRR